MPFRKIFGKKKNERIDGAPGVLLNQPVGAVLLAAGFAQKRAGNSFIPSNNRLCTYLL